MKSIIKVFLLISVLFSFNAIIFETAFAETSSEFEIICIDSKVSIGESSNFFFSVNNVGSIKDKVFSVSYNPNELQLIDFAAQTASLDSTVGKINGTDLEILSHSNGLIKFKLNKELEVGKEFSGTLSVIKFNGKINGTAYVGFCTN